MDDFTKKLLDSNLLGAETLEELNMIERKITRNRIQHLRENPIELELDYKSLKFIHGYLFDGVYAFAGKDRFDMGICDDFGKRNSATGKVSWFCSGIDIPKEADKLFRELKEKNHLKDLKFFDFIKESSSLFIELNNLHPFREGNGRTQRIFTEHLAKEAGYNLDLETNINKQTMIDACNYGMNGDKSKMFALFLKNCKAIENKKTIADRVLFFVENKKAAIDKKVYVKDSDKGYNR
jgi:cell filamentation protein